MTDYFPYEERKTMDIRLKNDCDSIWGSFLDNNSVKVFLRCEDLEKDLERYECEDRVKSVICMIKYECEDNTLVKALENFRELIMLLVRAKPIFWNCENCGKEFKKKELIMTSGKFLVCKLCKREEK